MYRVYSLTSNKLKPVFKVQTLNSDIKMLGINQNTLNRLLSSKRDTLNLVFETLCNKYNCTKIYLINIGVEVDAGVFEVDYSIDTSMMFNDIEFDLYTYEHK